MSPTSSDDGPVILNENGQPISLYYTPPTPPPTAPVNFSPMGTLATPTPPTVPSVPAVPPISNSDSSLQGKIYI